MSDQGGVFSIMGNTFSLWARFREEQQQSVLGLYVSSISNRGFVVIAVAVESPVVKQFANYVSKNSNLHIYLIDGDPTPNALWLGHWTHFAVKALDAPLPLTAPASMSSSERYLRRLLNGELPTKRQPRR